MIEEIPDKNIFMMCKKVNPNAFTNLPADFHIRNCSVEELDIWKQMPFDNPKEAAEYQPFMDDYFETVYGNNRSLFFEKTLFVCDKEDRPIATCLIWKSYGAFNTIQWLKVKKEVEGKGIGRALLSLLLKDLPEADFPIYLHTQPGSYRAIKLYADFGFCLLMDEFVGNRKNEIVECLPILEKYMPKRDFKNLQKCTAPKHFIHQLKEYDTIEF